MPDDKEKPKKKPPGKPRDREDPPGLFPEHSAYDLEPIVIPAHEKLHVEPVEEREEREYTPLPEYSAYDLEPIVIPADMKLGPTGSQLPDESHYDLPALDRDAKLMPFDTSEPPKVEKPKPAPPKVADRASVFAPEQQSTFAPEPPVSAPEPRPFAPEPPNFSPQMPSLAPPGFEPSSPFGPSPPHFPTAMPPPPPGAPPQTSSALPYLWSQGQISNASTIAAQVLAGSYTILDTIGQGGMAIVYKARQDTTDRLVAIKTLKDTSPDVMKRFLREVEAHARLKHKNIVEAIDCVEAGNLAFLVMEYIEGVSLQDRIRREGRIENPEELASMLIQMCNALEHAHLKKIIHRDLKSGNFILLKDDFGGTLVKILDFGIAKIQDDTQRLTVEGKSLGSPLYMSPEQCTGATLTPSSDVYSLGVVAYEMVTGKLPYQRASIVEIMTAHCDPKIRPESLQTHRPDLPGLRQLNQVLQKALETRIENRFTNMYQFRQGIEFWINAVRQGQTAAALPDEIMVNRIDPDEARSDEIKKSMYQLMEVRREQLGKTTTQSTIERQKFVSEVAPRKGKGKLILQLFMLFALFTILTLSMAVLVITNIDGARNFGWNDITKPFDSILGKNKTPSPKTSPPQELTPPQTETSTPEGSDDSGQATEKEGSSTTDSGEEPDASNAPDTSDTSDSTAGDSSSTPADGAGSNAPTGSAGSPESENANDAGAEKPAAGIDSSPEAGTTFDTSSAGAPETREEATSVKQSETSNPKGTTMAPAATTGGSKSGKPTDSTNQPLPDKTSAPAQSKAPGKNSKNSDVLITN